MEHSTEYTRVVALRGFRLGVRDVGSGPPLVFLHGVMANGKLWDRVVAQLHGNFRCIAPDLPLGSHAIAAAGAVDLTPAGIAHALVELLDHSEIERAVFIGNDYGGALCQIIASRYPHRVAGLVLTPCDAYEVFPPFPFQYLSIAARLPGGLAALARLVQFPLVHNSPLGYGWLSYRGLPGELAKQFVRPTRDPQIREDLRRVILGISHKYTQEAATEFSGTTCPVLVVWPTRNPFFPIALAQRLLHDFPNARLVEVTEAYTYVPIDQPIPLARAISDRFRSER